MIDTLIHEISFFCFCSTCEWSQWNFLLSVVRASYRIFSFFFLGGGSPGSHKTKTTCLKLSRNATKTSKMYCINIITIDIPQF